MTTYTTIISDDERYELSALLCGGKYSNTSLLGRGSDGKELFFWDNDDYVFGELMDILNGLVGFKSLVEDVPVSDFKDVLELLNEGIKLGFYEERR